MIIYTYDSRQADPKRGYRSGPNYAIARAIETALEQIMTYNRVEGKPVNSSILLIGRFGFDGDRLERSGLFEYTARGSRLRSVKYPKLNITFMTAHSSKGLGYDNVIVVNGRNETYGFPSKIENDPVLSFVVKEDKAIEYAEERRLFYVAMTRTKNRVFFIAPEQNPSEFLLELKHDYKNVVLNGDWNEDITAIPSYRKTCPMCGYPMQFRYKNAYGLKLYICTNDPEVCGFMTNEYKAGKLSIIKCDECRDGYLVVKPVRKTNSYMLGCTNYKKDGTGCSRTMSPNYFYEYMGIKDTTPAPPVKIPKGYDIKPKGKGTTDTVETKESKVSDNEISVINAAPIKPVIYKDIDLNKTLATILQTLADISKKKFYSSVVFVDILRGTDSDTIRTGKLNEIESFGSLSKVDREDVTYLIEWLIEKKFILKTKGKYPVLHPTYKGLHYEETMTRQQLYALRKGLEKDRLDFKDGGIKA